MKTWLRQLRQDATAAHVAPFFLFLGLLPLAGPFRWEHDLAPWWRQQPELWLYPLQTFLCLAVLAFFWPNYRFRPLNLRAVLLGVVFGAVGIAFWILPGWLHQEFGWENKWLGLADRSGPGFDPSQIQDHPTAYWLTVLLRFTRMTVAVALLEEVFWRGFVWRWLTDRETPWQQNPFASPAPLPILLTSLAMMLAHQPVDWPACLIWSLLTCILGVLTRSLGACVLCHATSNLLLGLYVMLTRQWGYW